MKITPSIIPLLVLASSTLATRPMPAGGGAGDEAGKSSGKVAVTYAKHALQGYDMRVWISNQMAMGLQAWDCVNGNCIPEPPQYGLEYPAGSGIEHLYGGGPWIGGKVDGVRRVTEGYNGNSGDKYFRPDPAHPLRERIWRTSIDRQRQRAEPARVRRRRRRGDRRGRPGRPRQRRGLGAGERRRRFGRDRRRQRGGLPRRIPRDGQQRPELRQLRPVEDGLLPAGRERQLPEKGRPGRVHREERHPGPRGAERGRGLRGDLRQRPVLLGARRQRRSRRRISRWASR